MHVLVVTIDIKPGFKDRPLSAMLKDWFASPPVVGSGPSIFPADADWSRNWKAR